MKHSTTCFPKVQYPSLKDAQEAAFENEQRGKPAHSYPCPDCDGFHIETIIPNAELASAQ
jgi:hypothetical protein